MKIFDVLLKNYANRSLYDQRKAEYSLGFVIILTAITISLTFLKAAFVGVSNLEISISVINICVFFLIFILIYKGNLYLGVWVLIFTGIARVLNVYFMYELLHYYVFISLILIASSFIHCRKSQYHFVNLSVFTISIYNTIQSLQEYRSGRVDYETAIVSLISLFYLVAIMYMITVFARNTDKEIKMTAELRELATKDHLTDVYNRRKLDTVSSTNFTLNLNSILVMDFDHFKKVNDKYGHMIGDEVLKETVTVISKIIRKDDFIVRFGGEEFIIVLRDCNEENSTKIAEKIRDEVSKHYYNCINGYQITISIGVTTMGDNEGVYQAIDRADKAMYSAKSKGRNQVIFFPYVPL